LIIAITVAAMKKTVNSVPMKKHNDRSRVWVKRRVARFSKFVLVGLSGTIMDYGLFLLLKDADWNSAFANVCAASLGMLNNFYWNRQWTFSGMRNKSSGVQFVQYFVVSLVGLAISTLVVVALEEPFEMRVANAQMAYIGVKLVASVAGFVWNYAANLNWTFREVQQRIAG